MPHVQHAIDNRESSTCKTVQRSSSLSSTRQNSLLQVLCRRSSSTFSSQSILAAHTQTRRRPMLLQKHTPCAADRKQLRASRRVLYAHEPGIAAPRCISVLLFLTHCGGLPRPLHLGSRWRPIKSPHLKTRAVLGGALRRGPLHAREQHTLTHTQIVFSGASYL